MSLHSMQSVDTFTLTGGRVVGTVAALLALAGVIAGGLAVRRSTRGAGAIVALVAGLTATAGGVLVLAVADGGPGTGNGVVGGWAAVALGLTATALGLVARRARPAPSQTDRQKAH